MRNKKTQPRKRLTSEEELQRSKARQSKVVLRYLEELCERYPEFKIAFVAQSLGFKWSLPDPAAEEKNKLDALLNRKIREYYEQHEDAIQPIVEQDRRNRVNEMKPEAERDFRSPFERFRDDAEDVKAILKIKDEMTNRGSVLEAVMSAIVTALQDPEVAAMAVSGIKSVKERLTGKKGEAMVPVNVEGVTHMITKADYNRLLAEGKLRFPVKQEPHENLIPGENEVPPVDSEAAADVPPGPLEGEQPPTNGASESS